MLTPSTIFSGFAPGVILSDQIEEQLLLGGADFSTKGAYLLMHHDLHDPLTQHIWESCVSNKVKVFRWILHLNRLNARANLKHKNIINFASCPRWPHQEEDLQHLFFLCPASRQDRHRPTVILGEQQVSR
jgi:hypothetical protein